MKKSAQSMANKETGAGWRQATLGDFVATRSRGIVPNKTPDTIFELYSVPSLDTGAPEIVTGGEIGSNKQIVDEGTVLLCKINPRINRAWVVSSHTAHQKIASTEWITFPPSESFEPKYLAYYLKQDAIRDFLSANASGVGGSLMRVKPATLKDYPFPLAPVDQQERIVAEIEKQFSRLDEAVANLMRVKANLKRYKAAVLKAAVEGRLVETEAEIARREGRSYETGEQLLQRILEARRSQWQGKGKYKEPAAPDTTNLPELPEGWVWATIEQLTWLVTSGSRGWGDYYSDEGVLFIRAQDIKTDILNIGGVARVAIPKGAEGTRSSVSSQDILITITGANVTKSALVPALDEVAFVSQHVALLKLNLTEMAPFVFTWIVSPSNGRKLLESWAYGAGKPGLSLEQVRSLPVEIPPLAGQHHIVAEVDRRLSHIREMEAQVDVNLLRSDLLRQAILGRAFSGNLCLAVDEIAGK